MSRSARPLPAGGAPSPGAVERHATTSIVAVIVAYHPDPSIVGTLLERLLASCEGIVVVDNGNDPALHARCAALESARVRYLANESNLGVAAALNRGVATAWEMGATHVLLSDHDSLPAPDMPTILHRARASLEASGTRVAAIGPMYSDRLRPADSPVVCVIDGRFRRVPIGTVNAPMQLDYLITSGSLISRAAWDAIGPMNEALFIDYVDIEWGLRARRLGWSCHVEPAACMSHAIGSAPRRVLGRDITVHAPSRLYYQTRNAVFLLRHPDVPINWKRAIRASMLPRLIAYPLAVSPRLANLRMILLGLYHGLRGRMGPLDMPGGR